MIYFIDYIFEEKPSEYDLIIYDFGHIKGFLFNNEFTMYKIIQKEDTKEICELYNESIPMNVISIEVYKKPNFIVRIQPHLPQIQPLKVQPQPSQQQKQHQSLPRQQQSHRSHVKQAPPFFQQLEQQLLQTPQSLQHPHKNTQTNSQQLGGQINEMYKKTQQVALYSQAPLNLTNAGQQHQWTSLEQLMKFPLPQVCQLPHSQSSIINQNSLVSSKQKPFLRVRRPAQQLLTQHPNSTY